MALFGLFSPDQDRMAGKDPARQVMVVDQSDSLSVVTRLQIQQQARAWQAAGPNRLLVAFGAQVAPVLQPDAPWPALDGRATELDGALDLAGELLGPEAGRVILASDGQAPAAANVEAAVRRLAGKGHRLDVSSFRRALTRRMASSARCPSPKPVGRNALRGRRAGHAAGRR
jgi:hypothetical protein